MRHYIVPPIPDSIWHKPSHFIAFGFGTGAIPYAPGTFGTLAAIPFYLLFSYLPLAVYIFLVVLIALGSMWLCERVSREIKVKDHQGMCLDEIVGFLVTMTGAPHGLIWIVLGFILFRIFDIWKPWPINFVDKHVSGGFGMILDDVLAGILSLVILKFLSWLI
ncbi:MAG TPA: phosphatidylglycerophosphatase A [Gammaproteobacteria bacterium]|nr:phosphatidylglycerophosphatase A [Gammaproteobacteria bacterium]